MRGGHVVVFGSAILVSAGLLFCLQPMVGKMLLAPVGGVPAVWNTCMLFFQALLLGGYTYAHLVVTKLSVRRQAVVHIGLVALSWIVLPIAIVVPSSPTADPTFTVLAALGRSVGLPFFVLSTSAPLLQRWFSATRHPSAKDPYFLYAASNFGSMVALLAYPLLIEPMAGLSIQSRLWAGGYALFGALVVACVVVLIREPAKVEVDTSEEEPPPITMRDRARWLLYAFVPSSLLMSVTEHVTTEIAPIPLFWVVPLALYLLTFMLVFAKKRVFPHRVMTRIYPFVVTLILIVLTAEATFDTWLLAIPHLVTCFVGWMVCHGELVATRPHAKRLTEFYLLMSVGGVLGGIFNALIAPFVFERMLEYPLGLVAVAFCRPRNQDAGVSERSEERRRDIAVPFGLGAFTLAAALLSRAHRLPFAFDYFFGPAILVNYHWLARRTRYALGLGAIVLASFAFPGHSGAPIDRERNFFGVVAVTRRQNENVRELVHGNTIHGSQTISDDPAVRDEPLNYYHPTGPIGDVFVRLRERLPSARVASVGLGVGALASYARRGDEWTIYEINPVVVRMAKEDFTFLRDAPCGLDHFHFEIGDARLRLAVAPPNAFDLIVLDAFSSDAVPIHLLTREAFRLYVEKLAANGLVALHISNRHIDLLPPVARLVADAGLVGRHRFDKTLTPEQKVRGKAISHWIVFAREAASLGDLGTWEPLVAPAGGRLWTDDYSNPFSALRR